MKDLYTAYQRGGRGFNNTTEFTTTDTTLTLTSAKSASYTIFIQRIRVSIKTDAAETITFEDSAATPVFVQKTDSRPGANTHYFWDFGPKGKSLTAGKNLVATFSAAGLAGHIEWEGYQKK